MLVSEFRTNLKEIRRQIFYFAHKYAKQMEGNYKACFSYALKMQWACYNEALKKPVELQGSPKQIAWAEDIRKNKILAPLWERSATVAQEIEPSEDILLSLEKRFKFIKLLRTQKSAKWWISSRFDGVRDIARTICFTNRKPKEERIYSFGKYYNPDYYRLVDGQFVECDFRGEIKKKRA